MMSLMNDNNSSVDYIKNNLNYDVNLIWDNILRTQNQADIKKNLNLNFLLKKK